MVDKLSGQQLIILNRYLSQHPNIKRGDAIAILFDYSDRRGRQNLSGLELQYTASDKSTARKFAKQFYDSSKGLANSGLKSMQKMQTILDTKINSKNIVAFLDAYDKEEIRHGDSSIIHTVTSEIGASCTKQQRQVLMTILNKLCDAAKEAGVSEGDIQKARQDFETSLNKEFNAFYRRTNPKDMEKAIDFLRGAIAAKQNGGGEITEQEAIEEFNSTFSSENDTAQKDYKQARENEGWTARVGDTVCGWFGCNTIEEMDKKLGANADAVKKLASSKTEKEFKANYKEVFGIEFDKDKIAARQTAVDKYNLAQNCNSTIKLADEILQYSSNSYSGLTTALQSKFKYDNELINQIIDSYAIQEGISNPTEDQKKEMLIEFLNETKTNASQNLAAVSGGKTLEQMGKDVDLITRSAFGTNDIVKDVIQFNENQLMTEMITESAAEIAGTVALQFVPGLGQAAAARLATSAARWGTKAVKVANYATKAQKGFAAVTKLQRGTGVLRKNVQVGMQVANAGIATVGVDLSNNKSVKEATQKALMNMPFAAVGGYSSILAPKLMQTFGIADKALATEIAEEIINAAGSYGITKLEGGEYGQTDAFIDFASGLIMARVSHVKTETPNSNAVQKTVTDSAPKAKKAYTSPEVRVTKVDDDILTGGDISPAAKTSIDTETPEIVAKPYPEVKHEQVVSTPKKHVTNDEVTTGTEKTHTQGKEYENQSIPNKNDIKVLDISDEDLRNLNLDDESTKKDLLEKLQKSLPSMGRVPGRVNTLKEIQKLINTPEYSQMDTLHRELAKMILLRANKYIDKRVILDDIELSTDLKRRMNDIEACISENGSPNIAATLYKDGDFETMMAIAQIKGVDNSKLQLLHES